MTGIHRVKKMFMQIKAEINDLHENLPLAFENIEKFLQMLG